MKALVLCVRKYAFRDDEGREVRGVTVDYIEPSSPGSGDRRGLPVFNMTADEDCDSAFSKLPGVYDLDIQMRPGKANRPTLRLVGAHFVKDVDIAKLTN